MEASAGRRFQKLASRLQSSNPLCPWHGSLRDINNLANTKLARMVKENALEARFWSGFFAPPSPPSDDEYFDDLMLRAEMARREGRGLWAEE